MNQKSDPANLANDESDARSFESAEGFLSRSAPPDTEYAQGPDGESGRQTRLLQEWAAQTSRLISSERFQGLQLVSDRTSEHKVYLDSALSRAIKQTLPGQFGWVPTFVGGRWTLGIATPLDLRRWTLFNQVFGDDVRLGAS